MKSAGLLYIDFVGSDVKLLHELHGVVVRTVGRAKAGQGYADDIRQGAAHQLYGLCGDEQRQRRIEPSRYADDSLCAYGLKSLFQSVYLHVEDVLAAREPVRLARGNEGEL